MTKKVLVLDSEFYDFTADVAAKFDGYEIVCPKTADEIPDLVKKGADIVISKMAPVTAGMLDEIPGLKMLMKMGRSYFNIDVEAVRAKGLKMYCTPRKGPNCVAELGMTMILALSKDLSISHESVMTAAYRYRGIRPIITDQTKMAFHWMANQNVHEVRGKVLGIIGMGEIGCELSRRANAMGMRVQYYKRHPLSAELEDRFEASYVSLEELMKTSDYVCLAVPQTKETEGMITAELFEMMKPSAYFVNICRGGNVDEAALIRVLEQKRIAGAGLDVFIWEPLPEDSPILGLDNVILTPHIGGGTGTNKGLELTETMAEIVRIENGEKAQVCVA